MKENNVVVDKTYAFAIRIVNCYKYLVKEKKEFELSKQLLRCGTSIGEMLKKALEVSLKKIFNRRCLLHIRNRAKLVFGSD